MAKRSKDVPKTGPAPDPDPAKIAESLRPLAIPIDSITFDPANVRKHDDRSIDSIRNSYARFGQQKPIVIDADGVLIAGEGQLRAARSLGWKTIAAVRSSLQGIERTLYAIADNRTTDLSIFDDDALGKVLAEMPEIDQLSAGFTPDELPASESDDDGGLGGEHKEATIPSIREVTISCENEDEQRTLFERLTSEGLKCRVVTL